MPEPKRIDIGDLTEAVTIAVQRALEAQKPDANNPFIRNPRLICGIIIEPPWMSPPQSKTAKTAV